MENFIKYLDSYKEKDCIQYDELMNILNMSNKNFIENKYYLPSYVGETNINTYKSFYNPYLNPYYIPSSDSASVIASLYVPQIIPPIIKEKKNIDVNVNDLNDLIEIINKYPYDEKYEYNINLKSLNSIKDELIELNNMIGMSELKISIMNQLLYFIQELHIVKNKKDEKNGEIHKNSHEYKHTVIFGPPGTGKTEIAKIIGKMYSKIGILSKNIFKKVTRNDLVAGYLGQTALKTKSVINECLGGVLFIDEAYSLANGSQNEIDIYSKECIDTLCESLSDHRDDLMVIIAGYEDELNYTFFQANTGLESRFIWRFKIDEYNALELCQIFMKKINETDWVYVDEKTKLEKWFTKNKDKFKFYGRDIELLFTFIKIYHSTRIYGKDTECRKKIIFEDINKGYELFIKNKKQNKVNKIIEGLYV